MIEELVDKWWLVALRGALAVLLGLVLIMTPIKTLAVITWAVGLFALVEGIILMLLSLIQHKHIEKWGLVFLQGVLALLLGLVIMSLPKMTLAVLTFFVGLWFVIGAVLLLIQAIEVRKEIMGGEWLLIAGALVSFLVGILLMGNITMSVAIMGMVMGVVFLFTGIFTVAFGLQLRRERAKLSSKLGHKK